MLVFSKARLVILSVPKTGTTAIEATLAPFADIAVLNPPDLKHAPVYRYNRFFRPMVEKFIGSDVDVAAVIREPISWLGSWYRYRQRPFLDGTRASTKGLSFEEFVHGYLAVPRKGFADIGSQAKFLEPRPNGTEVTHLFRYEAMERFVEFLETRLERDIDLPLLNVSPKAELELSGETSAQLQQLCAADFTLWQNTT